MTSPAHPHWHTVTRERAIDPAEVLYAHDGTIVTHRWMYIDGLHYVVADLREVTKTRSTATGGVMPILAVTALGLIAVITLASHRGQYAWVPAVLVAAVALVVAVTLAHLQPAQYSLHARYRGVRQLVLTTRDPRRFGQVYRAVQRAVTHSPR